jgi:hypothetical protein
VTVDARRFACMLFVLSLLVGACGNDPPADPAEDRSRNEVADDDSGGGKAGGKKNGAGDDKKSTRKGAGGKGPGASGSGGTRAGAGEGAAEDDGSSAYYPARGTYSYKQSGFEEFCDSTRCEKEDLPPTQNIEITYAGGSGNEVVVVTEARSSGNRMTRTTTRHTPERALITKVQVNFDYQGFEFNNTYQPDPPVESLRYPLRSGMQWSGMWKDSTSGDYAIDIGDKETITVGGATVQAYRIRTQTRFRGEFDGDADVTVWVDPATSAVVKTTGELHLQSMFGRYNSEFSATLRSAPGYQ